MAHDKLQVKESLGALVIKKPAKHKKRNEIVMLVEKEDPGNRDVKEDLQPEKQ